MKRNGDLHVSQQVGAFRDQQIAASLKHRLIQPLVRSRQNFRDQSIAEMRITAKDAALKMSLQIQNQCTMLMHNHKEPPALALEQMKAMVLRTEDGCPLPIARRDERSLLSIN
ncbi:MAG TPA: hypothetical protein VGG97_20015 [Bryobacteraceae bacterium]